MRKREVEKEDEEERGGWREVDLLLHLGFSLCPSCVFRLYFLAKVTTISQACTRCPICKKCNIIKNE